MNTNTQLIKNKSNNHFLCHVQDDMEFYVSVQTGESGMSQRALAKMCGVTHKSVATYLTKNPYKLLTSKDKPMATFTGCNGAKIIHEESCMETLGHYAYNAGRHCKPKARSNGIIWDSLTGTTLGSLRITRTIHLMLQKCIRLIFSKRQQ